jgi:DNA-binding transcriptional MerR regulator
MRCEMTKLLREAPPAAGTKSSVTFTVDTIKLKLKVNFKVKRGGVVQIGELARRSGLTASRIRFYEEQGLLKATRQANGYRTYSPDALLTLNIIISAQRAGFALEDIGGLLPSENAGWQGDELLSALIKKVEDIKAMQKRLSKTRKQIESLISSIESKPEGLTCAENTDRVLTHFRAVTLEPE